MKIIFIQVLLIISTKIVLTNADSTYKAGIIEYHPLQHNNLITYKELCKKNVENYIDLLKKAPQLDIAVFPEATITTLTAFNHRKDLIDIAVILPKLPFSNKPDVQINPCSSIPKDNDFPEYFKDISCAARDLKTYIVINTIEKIVCEEDDEREAKKCLEKWNLYNANVVFDRNGDVIAKYRKFNLFHEPQNCRPKYPEHVSFSTDFGVTFGTFICFDILFEQPGMELVRKFGIKHFVYPTMWFAEAPFLTALQAQNMWASGNNVVLLAANANDPKVGSGGSGIYQGLKGPRNFTIVANGSKLIIADVYKDLNEANRLENDDQIQSFDEDVNEIDRKGLERDGFRLLADNLKPYASFKIDGNVDKKLCHRDLCCRFNVQLENKKKSKNINSYKYRAFVFSGVRSFHGPINGGLEICAVVFCKDETQESCGQRILPYSNIEWSTTFKSIEITASIIETEQKVHFPNTLLSSLEPISPENYEWSRMESTNAGCGVELTMKLTVPERRLLTFGICGRDFSRDHEQPDKEVYDKIEL